MKHFVVTLAIVAMLAVPALAGQNPDILIGLDKDPPNEVNRYDPAMSEMFSFFLVFRDFGSGGGISGCAFMFERTFGGVYLSTTNLLGGLTIGTPETGCSLTALECQYPDGNGEVIAAEITYLYTGTPGTVTLVGDPFQGAITTDCNVDIDVWLDYSHFGVGQDAPQSPVAASSWGSIKALYR